ncbi:hypothetical protein E2C01_077215 [Portunus trituberculatus]|uniref:Uncharacterized protein n=1 Tax=Portunus trituberculatus TaxID=210409 RepID=A0A5B7IJR8_PORTR|nr:hypothetical protein [Portunus trituberculatus]
MRFRRGPVALGSADNAIRLSSQPRLVLQEGVRALHSIDTVRTNIVYH